MEKQLTHFDQSGNAIMVDVSNKEITSRIAIAKGSIKVNKDVIHAIKHHEVKKGDVLAVARVAGIMAVKQTSSLIPMCHTLLVSKCSIDFNVDEENCLIEAQCLVKINGQTGVEMEALTGVNIALLTIYDMCKAIDRAMVIQKVYVAHKSGGKSGEFNQEVKS